jgi:hypothetical protein
MHSALWNVGASAVPGRRCEQQGRHARPLAVPLLACRRERSPEAGSRARVLLRTLGGRAGLEPGEVVPGPLPLVPR